MSNKGPYLLNLLLVNLGFRRVQYKTVKSVCFLDFSIRMVLESLNAVTSSLVYRLSSLEVAYTEMFDKEFCQSV